MLLTGDKKDLNKDVYTIGVYGLVYVNMRDIFDAKILCKKCGVEMKPVVVEKRGLQLRAVKCLKCNDKLVHPSDLNCLNHFNDIKGKTFSVKLRVVGNSHAISIPKEIVNFMNEQQRDMDDMVRLCFEDFRKLSLRFGGEDD